MPLQTVALPNRTVKLGRRRPVARCPHLHLANYLLQSLPAPPPSADYTERAKDILSLVYLNDRLGICVIAMMAHTVGLLTGNVGKPYRFTDQELIALYSAVGGYVPGDPSTDQGCDEQTAMNYWQQNGAPAGSHQIAGWLALNPTHRQEVAAALWLFENLQFGVELPNEWLSPGPQGDGFVWDVAGPPNPNQGHAFLAVGYNDQGVQIDTWGMVGTITWAAVAKYAASSVGGNLYTVLSHDGVAAASQKAPNGVSWRQLVTDFDSIGGTVPIPNPPPPPPGPTSVNYVHIAKQTAPGAFPFLGHDWTIHGRVFIGPAGIAPGNYLMTPAATGTEAVVASDHSAMLELAPETMAVPAGSRVNWQALLEKIKWLIATFGPEAVPLIKELVLILPLTPIQKAIIEALLAAVGG